MAADSLWAIVDKPPAPPQTIKTLIRLLVWLSALNTLWDPEETRLKRLRQQCQELLARPELAGQDIRHEQALVLFMPPALGRPAAFRKDSRAMEQSLALFQELGERWWEAVVLDGLGAMSVIRGDWEVAKRQLRASQTILESVGDTDLASAYPIWWLVNVLIPLGELEEAERLARQMIRTGEERYGRVGRYAGLIQLAYALNTAGRYAEAQTAITESLGLLDELGAPDRDVFCLFLAIALMGLGKYDPAWEQAQKTYRIGARMDDPAITPPACMVSGRLAWIKGKEQEAERWFQESVERYERAGKEAEIAWAWTSLGMLLWQQGRRDEALPWMNRALRIGLARRTFDTSLDAIALSSLVWLGPGQIERAAEIYAVALRYPMVANSRWYDDMVGRQIAAAATALPPDVVASAQARGRARDLWDTARELLAELEHDTQAHG